MESEGTHILIAGGGVAALEAAFALQSLAEDRLRVELVAPKTRFWYRPLAVAEPFGRGEVGHFELSHLAAKAGATFTRGEVVSVDAARRLVYTPARSLSYDSLLLACGTLPRVAVTGALTFRGPADTRKIEQLLRDLEGVTVRRVVFAVPVGVTWSLPAYELALLTAAHLTAHRIHGVTLELVTPEREPLELFGGRRASRSQHSSSGPGLVSILQASLPRRDAGSCSWSAATSYPQTASLPFRVSRAPGSGDPTDLRRVRARRPARPRARDAGRPRGGRHHRLQRSRAASPRSRRMPPPRRSPPTRGST